MKKSLILTLTLATAALGGCGTAPLLVMPDTPKPTEDIVASSIEFSSNSKLDENVVQLPSHKVKYGSSVVINVPQEIFEDQSKKDGKDQDFKTKDFFSEAEQAIEKQLLRKNFRVLSRAKLEAELRKLRDENRCNIHEWNCLRSQVSPEAGPILDDLKAQFDRKQISAADYAQQIGEFRNKMQTSSAGRSRTGDEKELTDISEVIRAAQSPAINAEYILQINVFDTNKKLTATTDVRQSEKARALLRANPKLKELLASEATHNLSCAIIGAALNAKLIHVKTGGIVWIGNHELNELSSGVQKLEIALGQRTYVTNERDVQRFVHSQNTKRARKQRKKYPVTIPAWQYRTDLIKEVVSGRCENSWNITADNRRALSRNVAKELIDTIAVH